MIFTAGDQVKTSAVFNHRIATIVHGNEASEWTMNEPRQFVDIQFIPSRKGFPKFDCITLYANDVTATA